MACAVNVEHKDSYDLFTSLVKHPLNDRNEREMGKILSLVQPTELLRLFLQLEKNETENNIGIAVFETGNHWYKKYQWLSGCERNQKLYCWPCLLFAKNSNRKSIWVEGKNFHEDLQSFSKAAAVHSYNDDHVANANFFNNCEETIAKKVKQYIQNEMCTRNKASFNAKVKKNRAVLKHLFDVAVWMYQQDMLVNYFALNRCPGDKFKSLFHVIIQKNDELKEHCHELGNTLTSITQPFLFHFLDYVQRALMCDFFVEVFAESKERLCSFQVNSVALSFVVGKKENLAFTTIRYVDRGVIQENFLNVDKIGKLGDYIPKVMAEFNKSVLSISYDGACTTVDNLRNLQTSIQPIAPFAVLVPSIEHPLSTVLLAGTNEVKGVQLFIATMLDLVENPNVLQTLVQLTKSKSLTCKTDTKWQIGSELFQMLLTERKTFISTVCSASSDPCLSSKMWLNIVGLTTKLQEFNFVFCLALYCAIFEITGKMSEVIENNLSDAELCATTLKRALVKLKILQTREKAYKLICDQAKLFPKVEFHPATYLSLGKKVIDSVIDNLSIRLLDIEKFEFLQLVDSKKFQSYSVTFPQKALTSLKDVYGTFFKIKRLRSELALSIYSDSKFQSLSVTDILKLMVEFGLNNKIPQAYKLFCLVATLPIIENKTDSCIQKTLTYAKQCEKPTIDKMRYPRDLPPREIDSLQAQLALVMVEKSRGLRLVSDSDFSDGFITSSKTTFLPQTFNVDYV